MFLSPKWFAFSHVAVLNSCFEFSFVVMHFCVVTKSPYIGKEFAYEVLADAQACVRIYFISCTSFVAV